MCLRVATLQASAGQRLLTRQQDRDAGQQSDLYRRDGGSGSTPARQAGSRAPPFELEVLEGVLMVATGMRGSKLGFLGLVLTAVFGVAQVVAEMRTKMRTRCQEHLCLFQLGQLLPLRPI